MTVYTNNLLVGGTASADSNSAAAVNMFDGNTENFWNCPNTPGNRWVKYDCGAGKAYIFIKLRLITSQPGYGMNTFSIQGSNDDASFSNIATGKVFTPATTDWVEFTFANTTAYRYLRIYCASGQSQYAGGQIVLSEMEAMAKKVSGGAFLLFLSEAYKRHKKLWTPQKKLILPEDLGFSY